MNAAILIFSCGLMLASATPTTPKLFASKIFYEIAKAESAKNIIFSPTSIETCLALAYLGAESETANEIKETLQLAGDDKEAIARNFGAILTKNSNEAAKLKIVNRIYIDDRQKIAPAFNELASKYFNSAAENLNFAESAKSAETINSWVEEQTEHKIKNLFGPKSFDAQTAAVLVNAIYFKANWTNTFESALTQKQDFVVGKQRKVPVDMMNQLDYFLYGDLSELGAQAVEMTYKGSDLSMLLVLPKSLDGLTALEAKLQETDLIKLSDGLKREKVDLRIPKFKIEFDISLKPVLEQLGIKTMFSPKANFNSLLASDESLSVTEVKHKAFIEVNESGTEAAAATGIKISLESLVIGEQVYSFTADHPFFFVIKDKENVYFAGHIVDF